MATSHLVKGGIKINSTSDIRDNRKLFIDKESMLIYQVTGRSGKGVREADGARLETVCCASNRGFESPPFRIIEAG